MKTKIETNFFCQSKHWPKRMKRIKKIVKKILVFNNLGFKKKKFYFLNFVFVDEKNIRRINKKYRNKNKITDVLTFVNNYKNEIYCDIFFSAETIKNEAKYNFIDYYNHITHLIIHCFLHVNGYDHKKNSDFIKMKKLEEKILNKLKIDSPYL